nr:hypothetical protein [Natranaeroarchaeum sulfidigenes]
MSATLTVLAGMSLMETIEDQQDFEEAETDMQTIQSELHAASTSQDAFNSFVSTNEDVRVGGDATVMLESGGEKAEIPLQSLVRDTDTGHVTLEGGGIFRTQDGHTTISSPPDIRIDDEGIDIQLSGFDGEAGHSSDELRIETGPEIDLDEDTQDDLDTVIDEFVDPDEDPKLELTVESEHAEAWERHFQNQDASVWSITTDLDDDEVEATIYRGDGEDGILIKTDDGYGLDTPNNHVVETNDNQIFADPLLINAEDDAVTPEMELSVCETDGTLLEDERVAYDDELSPDEEVVVGANNNEWLRIDDDGNVDNSGNAFFNPRSNGDRALDLTEGERYEYRIETDPGEQDHEGWFYYTDTNDIDGGFVFEEVQTETVDGEIRIRADITNIDDSSDTQDIELEIEGVADPIMRDGLDLDQGETETVGWQLDESSFPEGEYDFTLSTESVIGGDEVEYDGTVTAPNAVEAFRITDDLGVPEDDWIGENPHIVSSEDDVTIKAEITNQYPEQETQDITLDIDGEPQSDTKETTLDSGESKEVELTVDDLDGSDSGELYEYTIATEDDELDEAGAFLVVDEPSEFEITGHEIDGAIKAGSPLSVNVDIDNQGPADEQFVLLTDFDDQFVDSNEVEIDNRGTANDVSLTWGEVVPADDGAITVTTATDSQTIAEPDDIDPFVDIKDVSIDGPIEQGESATVDVDITTTGDAPDDHVLQLNDSGETETVVSDLDDGEGTVSFEYDTDADVITHRLHLETYDQANNVVDAEADEVLVVERDGPVCGDVDYEQDEDDFYLIETVDQLQCINEHGLDENYRLANDIDAHGTEYWNPQLFGEEQGFEPIGSESSDFTGTLDGDGNEIRGLSIDRPSEDGVGLIGVAGLDNNQNQGSVGDGAYVERLRLSDIDVAGNKEVGGLAGNFAGTVEDVSVEGTVTADEQRAAIVVGRANNADLSNRIVAVGEVTGGSTGAEVDRGIGAIVGRPSWYTTVDTGYAQADVTGPENVGGLMGTSSRYASEFEQMYFVGDVTATNNPDTAGAITGLIEDPPRGAGGEDVFDSSVYWETSATDDAWGSVDPGAQFTDDMQERSDEMMQGFDVNQDDKLGDLDFEEDHEDNPWVAIPGDYPRFAWELAAEGQFEVDINEDESTTSVTAGEEVDVSTTITSRYADRDEDATETQTITLIGPDGDIVASEEVTIDSTLGTDEEVDRTITWPTSIQDEGDGQELTVRTEDDQEDTITVDIDEPERGVGSSDPDVDGGDIDIGDDIGSGDVEDIDLEDEIDIGVDVIEIS